MRHFLTCWVGGVLLLGHPLAVIAQGPCSAAFNLEKLPAGIVQEGILQLSYPSGLSVSLDDLPVDWQQGKPYDLILWAVESQFKQTALQLTVSSATEVETIVPAVRLSQGIYRFSFDYQAGYRLFNLSWLTQGASPVGHLQIGFWGVQERGCELSYHLGNGVPDPKLWLTGDGPSYDQAAHIPLGHGQQVQHWQSLDAQAKVARQPSLPFQPHILKGTGQDLQGHPLISFDGGDDLLALDYKGITPQGDFTMFIVFKTGDEYGTMFTEVDTPSYYARTNQCQAGLRFGKFSHRLSSLGWDTFAQSYFSVNNREAHIGMVNVPPIGSRTVQVDGLITGAHIINAHQDSLPYFLIGGHQSYSSFKGEMAEILVFEPALEDETINQVQTYLSLKFGVPLQVEKYHSHTGDSIRLSPAYRHHAGQCGVHLSQFVYQPYSSSQQLPYQLGVEILAPQDGQSLFWGDNGQSLSQWESIAPGNQKRMTRVWRFQEPHVPVGRVKLTFAGLPENLKSILFHPADTSFSDDSLLTISAISANPDGTYEWEGDLPDGGYLTFSDAIEPLFVWDLDYLEAKLEERDAVISWQTSRERKVSVYQVERSVDGELFTPIGQVEAKGSLSAPQFYQFKDPYVSFFSPGKVFYRLRAMTLSSYFAHSSVQEMKVGSVPPLSVVAAYLPQEDAVWVRINSQLAGGLQIRMINLAGQPIWQTLLTNGPHIQNIKIPALQFPSGVYFVEILGETERSFSKVLISN